ncbi:MAG TPA: SRPBCC family protein [Methylophaga aminisulfidivorans]|uniref:SRPBCC family protein n=2 Tax=root TaxID=1 RepID=A0A7C1ZW50_9GAMM|nr:SRPBCC family protein [Methylophaga aminisulfidivorans]HEC74370.1 SRPBCC family protein [Methylophaga aminisulfidivorans]
MKKLLQFFAVTLAVLPMVASAHGPTRQTVKETIFINAAPAKVWSLVGDFKSIDKWHPAIASAEMLSDTERKLTVKADGNPTITEKLEKLDNDKMMMIYKIEDMSVVKTITFNSKDTPYFTLPINNYKSWLSVKAKDGGSEVTWKGKFYRSFLDNPPVPEGQSDSDAVAAVKGVYTSGLDNLKAMLEK